MAKYIVRSLQKSGNRNTVIVIDALDECEHKDKALVSQFLTVLDSSLSEIPNVKILITTGLRAQTDQGSLSGNGP